MSEECRDDQEAPALLAYRTGPQPGMRLVPAGQGRGWIDATREQFARRCLPLLIANQAGWFVLSSHALTATWDGGDGTEALTVASRGGSAPLPALSHFGHGILTWHVPYLFRTPPGWQLLARGPANWPKDGATALEGIVETDWAVATFTMNWKLTRPGLAVEFARDEPICMVVPVRCTDLEAFRPAIRDLAADPALQRGHAAWSDSRRRFLDELQTPDSDAARGRWQKDYFRGTAPDGATAPVHRTKLRLHSVDDPDGTTPAVRRRRG